MRTMLAILMVPALAAAGPAPSEGIRLTTDRTVDTSSLDSIVRDVFRLAGAKTNDEKAIAIHTWLHHAIFHNAYPVEKGPQSVGPLKAIRVYGWGLCGGQHTVLKALFETAGWTVRYRGWDGHTTIEVNYDNRWHYFDVFLKCYFWTKDRKTIAGQDDINADPSIVLDAEKEGRVPKDHYLCCGDEAKGVVDGCKTSKPLPVSKHEDGWASVTGRDQGYNSVLNLPAGATLLLEWKGQPGQIAVDGQGRHTCGTKDFRSDRSLGPVLEHYGPRNHSNGRFAYTPDFSRAGDVADITLTGAEAKGGKLTATAGQGVAIVKLPLPYVYVSGELEAAFEGDGKVSLSVDGGKTWGAAPSGDISAQIKQKYDVQLKAEFAGSLSKLRLNAVVEHNRSAQPHLLQGKNLITVTPVKGLMVTYCWEEATAVDPAKRSRFEDVGVKYAPSKSATWDGSTSGWTIDVGGNTPPKMISLEYAVRSK